MMTPIKSSSPALPDVRPAPQAGCFVSRLKFSKDSAQIALRHRAFGTVAVVPSSTVHDMFQQSWPKTLLGNMEAQRREHQAE